MNDNSNPCIYLIGIVIQPIKIKGNIANLFNTITKKWIIIDPVADVASERILFFPFLRSRILI